MHTAYLASAASVHTLRWVHEMAARGHNVDLVTMHSPVGLGSPGASVRLHTLPWRGQAGYYLNRLACQRLMRKIQPDLVHVHYASGYGTLARVSGLHPVLLSVWGSDVTVFPAQAAWKERVLRRNLAAADCVACTSLTLRQATVKYVSDKRVVVTPFGVDCDQFRLLPGRIDLDGEFVVGTLKILEKTYGIDCLMRAFALVARRYRGRRRLRLIIAGDGSERTALKTLAVELGVSSMTEFLGIVAHRDVPSLMNRLSAFVCVSRWESFGVSVLEASACGVPVIVSDAGGLTEVVDRNVTAFVVPRDDPERTADAIAMLIDKPDLARAMGTAGREFVCARYNWRDAADQMERLYDRVARGDEGVESSR